MKAIVQHQFVFDQDHYLRLIEARGELIRRVVRELKAKFGMETTLDAGCGVGFFAQILSECGLAVTAFDGREENAEEARRRFPRIHFEHGNVQDPGIERLGSFDLVLCFGLLYHLENPFLAIRNLRALTRKGLLLESMCLPDEKPWMLLREEPRLEDQSLTDVAFYASEGCVVKMLYRAGFCAVHRVAPLPDHDDFRDTPDHSRRRTVLFASSAPVSLPGFIPLTEPCQADDPWAKSAAGTTSLPRRLQRFLKRPAGGKYAALAQRFRRWFPGAPVPVRLPFGAWFLAGESSVDAGLLWGGFEKAELTFVEKFLQPGMTVLDIGAHHGLYTLLASKRVGRTGRVIAFEPSPREQRKLVRNVRLNSCHNVRIEPLALGSEPSQAHLFVVEGEEDGCNSLRPPAVDASLRSVRVNVVALDDYLQEAGIDSVDFVKVDVEGAEREVLRGAPRLLNRKPQPVILAEVQDIRTQPWGYPAREIVQMLDHLSYGWFQLLADGTLCRIDTDREAYDANLVAIPRERITEVLQRLREG